MTARPLTEQDVDRFIEGEHPDDLALLKRDWLRLNRLIEAFERACGTNDPEVARHMIEALAESASVAEAEVTELRHTIERGYWLTLPGTAVHEELAAALAPSADGTGAAPERDASGGGRWRG